MGYQLLTRIRLTAGGFVLTLAILAALFVHHHLSPVVFTASVLVLAAIAGIVLMAFLQRFRDLDPLQPLDEQTLRRRMRTTKAALAIVVLCLFLALWKTRNGPIHSPFWVAMAFGLLSITGLIQNLRRGQAELRQLEDRRTP